MKLTFQTPIRLAREDYFEKVYTSQEFQALVAKNVQMRRREVLKEEHRGNVYYREVLQVPKRDLPTVVKKVVGADELSFVEKGTFFRDQHRIEFIVIPSVKPDRISIDGRIWFEPAPDGCLRHCELNVDVRIFGVGSIIEKIVIEDIRKGQERVADLINQQNGLF